jgi:hypothetical protein
MKSRQETGVPREVVEAEEVSSLPSIIERIAERSASPRSEPERLALASGRTVEAAADGAGDRITVRAS